MTPLDRPVPRTLRSQPVFPLTVAWLALGLAAGCGSGGPGGRGGQVGDPCDASRPCRSDLVCGTSGMCVVDEPPPDQGVIVLPDLGPGVTLTGIELTPVGETAELTIGATDTVQFSAVLRRSDNQTLAATGARFTASSRVLGTLDSVTGAFALNGLLGGSVTVTVSITIGGQTFTDTETLVVNLTRTIGGGAGGPTDPVTQFMGTPVTDAARTAAIQYPLDEVVMPQNVSPADVQWSCGADTGVCPEADSFRVTLEKPHARVVVYVRNADVAVNDHYLVDASAWRALAQSDPTDTMSVRVDRFDAAATQVVSGVPIDVNFAVAAVTGTVYYWDIDDEKIRRINDGAPASELLLPHPDSPLADDEDGDDCVGCHAISNSGRYMLANLHFANYGALYDLTRSDLAANPAPTEWPVSEMIRWRTASFSPDDTRAMVSSADGNDFLFLIDPFTGQSVTHTGTLPNPGTHPAWSRDGDSVAYIGNTNSWAGDITTGDLSMLPVTGPDAFGPGAAIHTGASLSGQAEGGVTDSYPTWSPDSQWLAFAHGTGSRSDPRDPDGDRGHRPGQHVGHLPGAARRYRPHTPHAHRLGEPLRVPAQLLAVHVGGLLLAELPVAAPLRQPHRWQRGHRHPARPGVGHGRAGQRRWHLRSERRPVLAPGPDPGSPQRLGVLGAARLPRGRRGLHGEQRVLRRGVWRRRQRWHRVRPATRQRVSPHRRDVLHQRRLL
jgi:hypothetical protein